MSLRITRSHAANHQEEINRNLQQAGLDLEKKNFKGAKVSNVAQAAISKDQSLAIVPYRTLEDHLTRSRYEQANPQLKPFEEGHVVILKPNLPVQAPAPSSSSLFGTFITGLNRPASNISILNLQTRLLGTPRMHAMYNNYPHALTPEQQQMKNVFLEAEKRTERAMEIIRTLGDYFRQQVIAGRLLPTAQAIGEAANLTSQAAMEAITYPTVKKEPRE
jgi:hypothetical protein